MSDEAVASETPTSPTPARLAYAQVRIVLAEPPFPQLALYMLPSVPRPGDLILVNFQGGLHSARVEWVNFRPHDTDAMVHLGVSFNAAAKAVDPGQHISDLERQVEKIIEMHSRVFEKSTSYSNVMMLAGYAGIFAIWSFVKQDIPSKAADTVAVLLGSSLLMYVTYELYGMYIRATPMAEVAKHTGDKAPDFLERFPL